MKIGDKIIMLKKRWGLEPYDINDIAIISSEIYSDGSFTCSILKNGCQVFLSMKEEGLLFKKYKKKIG